MAVNPIALRTVKTLWSFGRSECNRVKQQSALGVHSLLKYLKFLPHAKQCELRKILHLLSKINS